MLKPNKRLVGGFMIFGFLLVILSLGFFFGGKLTRAELTPVLFFEGSVSGLSVGSQVYFRGVPVGKVEKIQLMPNSEDKIIIPVYITFDPKVVTNATKAEVDAADDTKWLEALIAHGLKGKLQSQSVLTGQMMIELDFYPNYPAKIQAKKYGIDDIEIPTVPSIFDELSQNLQKIPLQDISNNTNALLQNLNSTIPDLLHQTSTAVAGINHVVNALGEPVATSITDFNKMVRDVSEAARAVSRLSDYLERHPEALLKGKGGY